LVMCNVIAQVQGLVRMWISSICESSHAPCVGMIRGSRNKQASNTFADMHQFCLSENSHVVLAGACVPCDRHVKLFMSVHLRQLQLLVFSVEGFAPVQSLISVDACTLHGRPAGRLLWAHVERVRQYRHAPRVSMLRHESWNQPFGIAAAD